MIDLSRQQLILFVVVGLILCLLLGVSIGLSVANALGRGCPPAPRQGALFWDFENPYPTEVRRSTFEATSWGSAITGSASQTGGGPAEIFDGFGYVHVTRSFGSDSQYPYLELLTSEPIRLVSLEFQHFHNHTSGYATSPSYNVQLQIDTGCGRYEDIGDPLRLDNANNGHTDSLSLGSLVLSPGKYKIRWVPTNLPSGKDTGTDYFAINDLALRVSFLIDRAD